MILVQISDTHVDASNSLVYGRFNTNAALEKAVTVINAMDPLPDLVLHTGDIASRGNVFGKSSSRCRYLSHLFPGTTMNEVRSGKFFLVQRCCQRMANSCST